MKSSKSISLILIPIVFCSAFFPQLTSCKKETITNIVNDTTFYDAVCPIFGTYSGTNTPNVGNSASINYTFQEQNLIIGRVAVGSPAVTFGGYKNTCDSVSFSVYYTTNSNYYIFKGKFSNNRNTIAGIYNNINVSADFGTFTISK